MPPAQPTTASNQLPTSVPLPTLPAVEGAKRLAAFAAVDKFVGLSDKVSREEHVSSAQLSLRRRLSELDPALRFLTSSTVLWRKAKRPIRSVSFCLQVSHKILYSDDD